MSSSSGRQTRAITATPAEMSDKQREQMKASARDIHAKTEKLVAELQDKVGREGPKPCRDGDVVCAPTRRPATLCLALPFAPRSNLLAFGFAFLQHFRPMLVVCVVGVFVVCRIYVLIVI